MGSILSSHLSFERGATAELLGSSNLNNPDLGRQRNKRATQTAHHLRLLNLTP